MSLDKTCSRSNYVQSLPLMWLDNFSYQMPPRVLISNYLMKSALRIQTLMFIIEYFAFLSTIRLRNIYEYTGWDIYFGTAK